MSHSLPIHHLRLKPAPDARNDSLHIQHCQIAPHAHPTPAPKRPEPSIHFFQIVRCARAEGGMDGFVEPAGGGEGFWRDEDGGFAVERPGLRLDTDVGGDVGVWADGCVGRRDARLVSRDGGMQAQRLHEDCIEDGEGVKRFCGSNVGDGSEL